MSKFEQHAQAKQMHVPGVKGLRLHPTFLNLPEAPRGIRPWVVLSLSHTSVQVNIHNIPRECPPSSLGLKACLTAARSEGKRLAESTFRACLP